MQKFRKIKHAFVTPNGCVDEEQMISDLVVVCEDGTLWRWALIKDSKWEQLHGPPLDGEES